MIKSRTLLLFSIILITLSVYGFSADESKDQGVRLNQNSIVSLLEGLNSDNLGLKTSCAYMLGELKVTEGIIPLMKVLRNDENEEARIASALALYKIGTPMSIHAVKQAASFDESKRVSKLSANFYNEHLRNKFGLYDVGADSTDVASK